MKINVGVFFGGMSVEHEVSVISGLQAALALDKEKYEPIPIYITKDNQMYTGPKLMDVANFKDIPALLASSTKISLIKDGSVAKLLPYGSGLFAKKPVGYLDVALPVVHGANVEDGCLAGFLECLGLPYAGCDVMSAALSMDKYLTKITLINAGLPVLPGLRVFSSQTTEEIIEGIEEKFSYPVIVKPINLGSSVGITKADDREALTAALDHGFLFAPKLIVEPAVSPLREINCSVLGDPSSAKASVCEEPIMAGDILSYEDKYVNQGKTKGHSMADAKRIIPADLPKGISELIADLAVKAFLALGCSGVVRVDFLMNSDTGEIFINELNTIPGSLSFYLWEHSGLTFANMLDEMIDQALRRQRQRAKFQSSFDTNILSGFSGGIKGKA